MTLGDDRVICPFHVGDGTIFVSYMLFVWNPIRSAVSTAQYWN